MRTGYRFGLGQGILLTVGVLVALMLIPGDKSDEATANTPRMLATSPELQRFLNDAARVEPDAPTADEVIAEVAAQPEIVAPQDDEADETETASIEEPSSDALQEPIESTTARTAVNMREGPSTSNPTMFVLQPDEKVAVLERDGGWAKVRRTDGATGWVYARYLGDAPPEPVSQPDRQPTREASREEANPQGGTELASLRLRSGPSRLSRVLLTVQPGTPLRVAERRPGWARVIMPNGVSGWIRTN